MASDKPLNIMRFIGVMSCRVLTVFGCKWFFPVIYST